MFSVYFHTGRSWLLVGNYKTREDADRSAAYVRFHRLDGLRFMGHFVESIKVEWESGAEFV